MNLTRLLSSILLISTVSYGQTTANFWVNPNKLRPLDFLNLVKGEIKNLNFVTVNNNFPNNWVTRNDVDTLMKLISSKEKCKCIVNPLSSYLPTTESSDLGGYAILLITSFKEKKKIDFGLHLCPTTNTKEVEALKQWWIGLNK